MLSPEIRLRQSIIDGNLLVVKRLLKRFPDLLENINSENGWSSLHYAAFNGRYLICVHLISLGHDKFEVLKTFKQNTSVHLSLMNGHEQTTHLLLQHFPNLLNFPGEDGFTPLHISSIRDYYKCVEMLLTLGANINQLDKDGNNSLHLSMNHGSLQSIKILINYGINLNLKNKNGLKPIDVASTFQVEKFYYKMLNFKKDDNSTIQIIDDDDDDDNDDDITTPTNNTTILGKRAHSNSLPPLPSVTTTRRSSTSSSIAPPIIQSATVPSFTRSPIPRSAISLSFNGSNSNSYTFSPTQGSFSPQISIKPPTNNNNGNNGNNFNPITSNGSYQYYPSSSSSPVLMSPISNYTINGNNSNSNNSNSNNNGMITSAIVEEGQSSGLVNSASLSSFPSMSSLNSGKNTPNESRSRTFSNANSNSNSNNVSLPIISKTRSNSTSSKTKTQPGKISPPNSCIGNYNLSRESTSNFSNFELEKKDSNNSSNSNTNSNSNNNNNNCNLLNLFDNDVRNKLNSKLENVSSDFKKKNDLSRKSSNSILNIPIASLRRKE